MTNLAGIARDALADLTDREAVRQAAIRQGDRVVSYAELTRATGWR
jgi:predicted transcriptional regulator